MGMSNHSVMAYPFIRFTLDDLTSASEDCSCNAGSMPQVLVRGVDDSLGRFKGNVALDDLNGLFR